MTDPKAELPDFLRFFHRIVAVCTMLLRKRAHPIWDKRPTSVVRLETPAAIIEAIAGINLGVYW